MPTGNCFSEKERTLMVDSHNQRRTAVLIALLVAPGASTGDTHVLSHGSLRVEIATATNLHAAEFGPRFDRTAAVTSVTVDGVELLGPWGLSDEFGLYGTGVLGYETSGASAFIKIGVGALLRDTTNDYHFAHAYPVQSLFPVAVDSDDERVSVRQQADTALPYSYHYVKTYSLNENNVLNIRYQLTNTGDVGWPFEHYNHHWFRLEETEIGPLYRASTGFELPAGETRFLLERSSLRVAAPLAPRDAAYYGSDLADLGAAENTFDVSVGGVTIVRYEGSFLPARFALFANQDGFCPEVFKRATLAPGATASWSATYRFMPSGRLPDEGAEQRSR
jgi:hypothetical protein